MADARIRRLALLRNRLGEEQLDGLLVSSLPNIRYLTGFSGSSAIFLVTQRESLLITDFRYEAQAFQEVSSFARVRVESTSLWDGLWAELSGAAGAQLLGFESAHLLHRDFERLLDRGARWHWRASLDLIERIRERKDEAEVASIRRAASMATSALATTLSEVRPGMTELQVAGVLEHHLREAGSEAYPFPSIIAAGSRSALPHARAGNTAIALGDLLLLDFGATADGYCADVTRTVVVGRASTRQREVYDAVRVANEAARLGVRPGMLGSEADAIARDVLSSRGFGAAFGHGLGHGVGLEVHEAPRLSRTSEAALLEDTVVTVEPGAYIPGWGGVRIEDDIHLNKTGADLLTEFPRELLELM